jgi:hypothetical protein
LWQTIRQRWQLTKASVVTTGLLHMAHSAADDEACDQVNRSSDGAGGPVL